MGRRLEYEVKTSVRLNMSNPQHVKINDVIQNLDPKIFKSKNQFIIDAIQFYIDNYGKETFVIKKKEKERAEYIRSEDIDDIKEEVIEAATNEATNIYNNLTDVNYALLPTFRTRLSCIGSTIPFAETPYEFQQKTVGIKKETKIITVGKMPLLPLTGVHHKHPINFSQDITSYTAKGREKIHKSVQCVKTQELRNVMKYRNPNESIEFNDNSISAYLVQQGNCYVMGNRLNVHQMKCIRKIPVGEGGTDKHTNIAFISEEIWRAVMTEDISETIKIMKKFNMDDKQRRRFNRLRENYGLLPIKKR